MPPSDMEAVESRCAHVFNKILKKLSVTVEKKKEGKGGGGCLLIFPNPNVIYLL